MPFPLSGFLCGVESVNPAASQVTNAGLAELASLRFLRCLELADCRMVTDSGLITVLCRLESSLTHLDLRRCAGVTDDGLDALRYLTNLIHLDLTSCCEISGDPPLERHERRSVTSPPRCFSMCNVLFSPACLCGPSATPPFVGLPGTTLILPPFSCP